MSADVKQIEKILKVEHEKIKEVDKNLKEIEALWESIKKHLDSFPVLQLIYMHDINNLHSKINDLRQAIELLEQNIVNDYDALVYL